MVSGTACLRSIGRTKGINIHQFVKEKVNLPEVFTQVKSHTAYCMSGRIGCRGFTDSLLALDKRIFPSDSYRESRKSNSSSLEVHRAAVYVEGSAKILEKNSERVFVGHRFTDFPLPGSRSYRVPGMGVCLAAAN